MPFRHQRSDPRSAATEAVVGVGLAPGLKLAPEAQALFNGGVNWSLAELDRLVDLKARKGDQTAIDVSPCTHDDHLVPGNPDTHERPG